MGELLSKSAKYSNFCVIKTTVAIPTKFCTVIETNNYTDSVSHSKMHLTNPKLWDAHHLEKIAIFWQVLTDFDDQYIVWHVSILGYGCVNIFLYLGG